MRQCRCESHNYPHCDKQNETPVTGWPRKAAVSHRRLVNRITRFGSTSKTGDFELFLSQINRCNDAQKRHASLPNDCSVSEALAESQMMVSSELSTTRSDARRSRLLCIVFDHSEGTS